MIGLTLKGTGGFYPQVIRSINLKLAKQKKKKQTKQTNPQNIKIKFIRSKSVPGQQQQQQKKKMGRNSKKQSKSIPILSLNYSINSLEQRCLKIAPELN